ncbi:ead/Ea22-like family protein [Intestinirhabdus alba]|uniref:Ead/Ea22-like family protein n=1 Tax=Intestinirhabdus alba TaxID=2899544 RepID=A0A6L6IEV8_9ENTR|nr:ead/Ea22-like family protein [Intestinirhabdus alba]MTH45372.1 ead/Ea22-like family protein [Intestinirhabdus alba]
MSNIVKQALREAATEATQGRWYVDYDFDVCHESGAFIAETHGDNLVQNAKFIAAANPATVLALLDELEHYKSREKRVTKLVLDNSTSRDALYKKLEAAERRVAELEAENEYIRNRYKELDLLIGKNILVMQSAIIEWQATSDAKKGLAWIYNTLFGPGELPDEAEKDAQAYFDRKYAPLDEEIMKLHQWFWERSEAERAAAGIGKGE